MTTGFRALTEYKRNHSGLDPKLKMGDSAEGRVVETVVIECVKRVIGESANIRYIANSNTITKRIVKKKHLDYKQTGNE